jgi:hypothetical protein
VLAGQSVIRAGNDLTDNDPVPGKVKTLTIQYAVGGTQATASAREGESIALGQPSEHAEAAPKKQQSSRRSARTTAPGWSNPLERGTYNRTQDQKYTDPSGRTYWIDIRGRKHYDQK